jgi:hypothetical protein
MFRRLAPITAGLVAIAISAPIPSSASFRIHPPKILIDNSRISTISNPATQELLKNYMVQAQKVAQDWYIPIVRILGAEPVDKPKEVTLWMDPQYDGVAETGGGRIRISSDYVSKHPDDLGMIVHELAHVVQDYHHDVPGWLVEGIADYVRWFNYEPVDKRPHPRGPRADARAAYRTTAAFLDWAQRTYNHNLVKKLNKAAQDGTYTEDLWKDLTGKTLDQLNDEWKATLK